MSVAVRRDEEIVAGSGASAFARVGMPCTGWLDTAAGRIDAAPRLRGLRATRARIGGLARTRTTWWLGGCGVPVYVDTG